MPFKWSGLPSGEIKSFPRVETNLDCPWLDAEPANRRRKIQQSNVFATALVNLSVPSCFYQIVRVTRKIDWPRIVFDLLSNRNRLDRELVDLAHPLQNRQPALGFLSLQADHASPGNAC